MVLLNDLYLDGQIFTDYADGLDDIIITYEEKENVIGYALSTELKIHGKAFTYVYNKFFSDPCAGRDVEINVSLIIQTCCADDPEEYEGFITFETVRHAEQDCIAVIKILARNPCQKNYEYFRDKSWFNNGFADAYRSPKVWYCIQTENFYLWFWLIGVLFPLLVAWEILETIIFFILKIFQAIDKLLNILSNEQEEAFENFIDQGKLFYSLDDLLQNLAGCGFYHFAPYYNEILEHNVAKSNEVSDCVLTLDAPFLYELPYSELAVFMSKDGKGDSFVTADDVGTNLNTSNAWNVTTLEMINYIKDVFNHKAIFLPNSTLHIDTYENLVAKAPVIVNVEQEYQNDNTIEPPYYKFDAGKYCYSSEYTYKSDNIDLEGNRNLNTEYSDSVIWDEDGGDNSDGVCKKSFEFAPMRAMFDRHTFSVNTVWDTDKRIDNIRAGKNIWGFILNLTQGEPYPRTNDMILSKHQTERQKLILLDPDARGSLDDAPLLISQTLGETNIYNYPMYLNYPTQAPELITNFHITDDPKHEDHRLIILEDFTFNMTAGRLATIKQYGSLIAVNTIYGIGIAEKVTLNFRECTITVSGVKLKCELL